LDGESFRRVKFIVYFDGGFGENEAKFRNFCGGAEGGLDVVSEVFLGVFLTLVDRVRMKNPSKGSDCGVFFVPGIFSDLNLVAVNEVYDFRMANDRGERDGAVNFMNDCFPVVWKEMRGNGRGEDGGIRIVFGGEGVEPSGEVFVWIGDVFLGGRIRQGFGCLVGENSDVVAEFFCECSN